MLLASGPVASIAAPVPRLLAHVVIIARDDIVYTSILSVNQHTSLGKGLGAFGQPCTGYASPCPSLCILCIALPYLPLLVAAAL